MRDTQIWIRLLSFTLAIAVHAAVLFGSGSVSQPPVVGTGGFSVELVEGPPGGGPISALPEPPPPHDRTIPEPPSPDSQPEPPPTDEMALPDQGTNSPSLAPPSENPKPNPVGTNLMASADNPMDHPGTAPGGSGPDGGGAGQETPGGGVGLGGPRYGNNPLPVYPLEARRTGQQGTVVLSVLVNAKGAVETLAVKESSGHVLLDQAALRAVRHWHFPPMTVAGIAVSSQVEQPVTFRLVQ